MDLPTDDPPERADAAANRKRILTAAGRLFAERGPDITMSDVAAAAGVGRGTLYRRYPDVRSVATALLDAHERELQQSLLSGAPPLGPGAPPRERLDAFYAAMVDLLEQHLPLALGAEQGAARFRTGAYSFWRTFVSSLLRESGGDDALVDALLAPLAPEVYQFQRHERGRSTRAIKAALTRLAEVVPDDTTSVPR
ncbi:TetR/AcrR family transcriptional regulator [Solicola gregarius]|uniref:TetR/AcrR family transcriptional regulator n=1 Tax=Solicola gregarius TaxID=2908642 RepID=A0AA46TKS1_9ACTN|nr:TetR/AcrR family transcriptional regulator [Solicola gregarius]UYM07111.1 TetR/AcrR family transcriptional regulator [Solicola gregarius]